MRLDDVAGNREPQAGAVGGEPVDLVLVQTGVGHRPADRLGVQVVGGEFVDPADVGQRNAHDGDPAFHRRTL